MKSRNLWALIIMLVCIVAGLLIGAFKGWSGERAQVNAAYESLEEMLKTRVETANNILTVAKRHLPETDEAVMGLGQEKEVLKLASASMKKKAAANTSLSEYAADILARLQTLPSVQADARDQMYVSALLPQMLDDSQKFVAQNAYNQAAQEFNQRFAKNFFSGTLARLLGVQPAAVFAEN